MLLAKQLLYFYGAIMIFYEVTMQHTEATFMALAHMQYNIFCKSNRTMRSVLSVVLIFCGIVNFSAWWGILIAAYGCYLSTSTYSASNHTARKLASRLQDAGMPFPCSKYVFKKNCLEIITMPDETPLGEPLKYTDIRSLGEDIQYFYVFRDEYGGYMIPKSELGDEVNNFRSFIEKKSGKQMQARAIPLIRLFRWLKAHSRFKDKSDA